MMDATVSFQRGVRGTWKPIRRGPLYRISLLAVAAMMLLVPLIYVAFVAGIGYLAFLHAVQNYPILIAPLKELRGQGVIIAEVFAVGFYVGPLLAAGVLLMLVLRPVFIRSDHDRQVYTVTPAEEPALYAFVGSLCTFIGAPIPTRIDIDATPTASAHLNRGLLSVLRRGDVVLTIGLPLIHGMNLTEFSGVLAHELGHFSQGAGMRAQVLIHHVNAWVARVVADAAEGNASIEWHSESQVRFILLAKLIIKCFIKLSLWVTKLLFMIMLFTAHLLSSIMSRQMEYDADRHEARFTGAASFVATLRRVMELSVGHEKTLSQIPDFWKNGKKLPDDVPAMVAHASRRLTPEQRRIVDAVLARQGAGWFSSHPAPKDRIRAVNAAAEPGIFSLDLPAISLLRDPHAVSVRASYGFYRSRLGNAFDQATMVPVTSYLAQGDRSDQAAHASEQALGFEAPTWRPAFLRTGELASCPDPRPVLAKLKEAKAALSAAAPAAREATERFQTSEEQLIRVELAHQWFESGHGTIPRNFDCGARNRRAAAELRMKLLADIAASTQAIDEAIEHASCRVECALRLLHAKGIEARLPNVESLRTRSAELVSVQASLKIVFDHAQTIRTQMNKGRFMIMLLEAPQTREEATNTLHRIARVLHEALNAIRDQSQHVDYPYESPRGRTVTLFEHLVEAIPSRTDPASVLAASQTFLERYPPLVHQTLNELASLAIEVEKAIVPAKRVAAETARTP
jgi:Zn-dependent protease with chaperone function